MPTVPGCHNLTELLLHSTLCRPALSSVVVTVYVFVYVHPIKPESQFNLETFSSPPESDRNQWPN